MAQALASLNMSCRFQGLLVLLGGLELRMRISSDPSSKKPCRRTSSSESSPATGVVLLQSSLNLSSLLDAESKDAFAAVSVAAVVALCCAWIPDWGHKKKGAPSLSDLLSLETLSTSQVC